MKKPITNPLISEHIIIEGDDFKFEMGISLDEAGQIIAFLGAKQAARIRRQQALDNEKQPS